MTIGLNRFKREVDFGNDNIWRFEYNKIFAYFLKKGVKKMVFVPPVGGSLADVLLSGSSSL